MIGFRLEEFLAAERSAVDAALVTALATSAAPESILAPMRYAVESGGKRLRPILCTAAYRAIRGEAPPPVYRIAAALELVHAYSLVHDDLPAMDDDPVRRGRSSTHVEFGVAAAAMAGTALIPVAVRAALEGATELGLDAGAVAAVVRRLTVAAGGGGMVGGQLLDLEAEGRIVGPDELERIHRLKTGALIAAGPAMGGLAAGASRVELDALDVYGRSLGLAFQIMDDILDVTGSSAILGKPAGRDSALAKATFPGLQGVDAARRRSGLEVDVARAALAAAGIDAPELDALAGYAVERDR